MAMQIFLSCGVVGLQRQDAVGVLACLLLACWCWDMAGGAQQRLSFDLVRPCATVHVIGGRPSTRLLLLWHICMHISRVLTRLLFSPCCLSWGCVYTSHTYT